MLTRRRLVVTDFSVISIGPIFKWQAFLKYGKESYPEKSVTKYKFTLRNIPEERRFHLYCAKTWNHTDICLFVCSAKIPTMIRNIN